MDAEKAAYIVERLTEVAGLYDQPSPPRKSAAEPRWR